MEVVKGIDAEATVSWRRCESVTFDNGIAAWVLKKDSYDLLQSYEKQPHRQLINAQDDESLLKFIKAWGPLRHLLDSLVGTDPIHEYRTIRDQMTWIARLRYSIENPEKQRSVLSDWNRVRDLSAEDLVVPFSSQLDNLEIPGLKLDDDHEIPEDWVQTAKAHEIENVCIQLVNYLVPQHFPGYRVVGGKGRRVVKVSLGVDGLVTALHWMMWQDVFQNRPISFCADCSRLITSVFRHERKFCSKKCAVRKTTREYQRRKREKERATSGTQKAR